MIYNLVFDVFAEARVSVEADSEDEAVELGRDLVDDGEYESLDLVDFDDEHEPRVYRDGP